MAAEQEVDHCYCIGLKGSEGILFFVSAPTRYL